MCRVCANAELVLSKSKCETEPKSTNMLQYALLYWVNCAISKHFVSIPSSLDDNRLAGPAMSSDVVADDIIFMSGIQRERPSFDVK